MNARRMMASIATTSQKKNTTIPGIEYPATDLTLATAPSYPASSYLFHTLDDGICQRTDTKRDGGRQMRAVLMTAVGGPEVLQLADLPEPQITGERDVKVRLRAAGINPVDYKLRSSG